MLEKQCEIEDAHFEGIKNIVIKAVKESMVWYQQSEAKDPRNDNLSGVILSRFIE